MNMKKMKNLIFAMFLSLSLIGSMTILPVFAESMDEEPSVTISDNDITEGNEELIDDISDDTSDLNEYNQEISDDISEDIDSEEDVLSGFVDAEGKDWSHDDHIRFKYDALNQGDTVTVTTVQDSSWDGVMGHERVYKIMDYTTAYDETSDAIYGVMLISGIDGGRAGALVRIPGVKNLEMDKEYEAEFLFDIDKKFGHGKPGCEYTIQIIDQRIYLFLTHEYKINSPESKIDADGRPATNPNYIFLLYSFDMNGENIKLHMREAYALFDNAKWPAWMIEGRTAHPTAIQKIDGKWYALFKQMNGEYQKTLLSNEISESGLDGFLSPSNEWFKLDKRYGAKYSTPGEDVWATNNTVTTYEQMLYVRQWMYDNGYTKNLYLSSLADGEDGKKKEEKEIEKEKKKQDETEYSGDFTTVSADKIFVVKDKIDANKYLGSPVGKVRYISSDKKIASASKSGTIKAKNPGKVIITRQMKVGKKWVNVSALKMDICRPTTALPKNTLELKADPNVTYNIADYILSEASDAPTYTISSSGMAVIGSDATKMTPLAAGKATITAKFNNYKLKIKVIVTP